MNDHEFPASFSTVDKARYPFIPRDQADVAELVDATDLKSVIRKSVRVRVPPSVLLFQFA